MSEDLNARWLEAIEAVQDPTASASKLKLIRLKFTETLRATGLYADPEAAALGALRRAMGKDLRGELVPASLQHLRELVNQFNEAGSVLDKASEAWETLALSLLEAAVVVFEDGSWNYQYESWEEFAAAEVPPAKWPTSQRQSIAAWLDEKGLNTRAIAPLLGVSKDTVGRDLRAVSASAAVSVIEESPVSTDSTVSNDTVEPEERKKKGKDGKMRKTKTKPEPSKEHKVRLVEVTETARMEGYSAREISKALTPKVSEEDIREIFKAAKAKGIKFDAEIKDLEPLPLFNWHTGEVLEKDAWRKCDVYPPPAKVDFFESNHVSVAEDVLRVLRTKRTLNAVGWRAAEGRDTKRARKAFSELIEYYRLMVMCIDDPEVARVAMKADGMGEAAEQAILEFLLSRRSKDEPSDAQG